MKCQDFDVIQNGMLQSVCISNTIDYNSSTTHRWDSERFENVNFDFSPFANIELSIYIQYITEYE